MKREAEQFLEKDPECQENLYKVILRPGLVYHEQERPISVPLGLASNLVHSFGSLLPGVL